MSLDDILDISRPVFFDEGLKLKIPLCCIVFFCDVWIPCLIKEIHDYSNQEYSRNSGIIECPTCLSRRIEIVSKSRLSEIRGGDNVC